MADKQTKIDYDPKFLSQFEVGKLLGRGATANVYLVRRKEDMKLMALKVIDKNVLRGTVMGFESEFKSHSMCSDYPGVLGLYAAKQDKKFIYILLEFVPAGNLFNIMCQRKFSEDKAKDIVSQIYGAIKWCHSKGVMHRDIKPENILIAKDGSVRLCDFGFACSISAKKNDLVGTIDYVAPEVLRRDFYGKEIDLWSLGVLYYELVVGKMPFYNEVVKKTKKMILSRKFSYPSHVSKSTRKEIDALLELDPKKRVAPRASVRL